MNEDKPGKRFPLLSAWFALTPSERRVVQLVLALAIVGLLTRYWHIRTGRDEAVPADALQEAVRASGRQAARAGDAGRRHSGPARSGTSDTGRVARATGN